jgi:hypothetical protein
MRETSPGFVSSQAWRGGISRHWSCDMRTGDRHKMAKHHATRHVLASETNACKRKEDGNGTTNIPCLLSLGFPLALIWEWLSPIELSTTLGV